MNQNQVPQWFLSEWNEFRSEMRTDIAKLQSWHDNHESNHHGRHGVGPGKILNKQNAERGGVVVLAMIVLKALEYFFGS